MGKTQFGRGILAGIAVFVAGVAVMVYTAMTGRVDLVADDYYQRGIQYESRIGTLRRTQLMEQQVLITARPGVIRIQFPQDLVPAGLVGHIILYRPSDRRLDRALPLALDSLCCQRIPTSELEKGIWKVQLSWMSRGQEYYTEAPAVVN